MMLAGDNQVVEGSVSANLVHQHLISAGLMSGECLGREITPRDVRTTAKYDIYKDKNVSQAVR